MGSAARITALSCTGKSSSQPVDSSEQGIASSERSVSSTTRSRRWNSPNPNLINKGRTLFKSSLGIKRRRRKRAKHSQMLIERRDKLSISYWDSTKSLKRKRRSPK